MMAIHGVKPKVHGVCIVPQGLEEGAKIKLEGKQFGLMTGKHAEFRFFSSNMRSGDTLGTVVEDAEISLEESSKLFVDLTHDSESAPKMVPVQVNGEISDVGTLNLYMTHTKTNEKWDLEFNVRDK